MRTPAPTRPRSLPALAFATALAATLAPIASAAPIYLRQNRFVEATVDSAPFNAPLTERERSSGGDTFDRSTRNALSTNVGSAGSPDGQINIEVRASQRSTIDSRGIVAALSAEAVTTTAGGAAGRNPGRVAGRGTAFVEVRFTLDEPHDFLFDPVGLGADPAGEAGIDPRLFAVRDPDARSAGLGASIVGVLAEFGDRFDPVDGRIVFNRSVASGGSGFSDRRTVSGRLEAGTYEFGYRAEAIVEDGRAAFAVEPRFLLTEVDGGTPAVVPLPGAASAGLLTLGGLGIARLRKRR